MRRHPWQATGEEIKAGIAEWKRTGALDQNLLARCSASQRAMIAVELLPSEAERSERKRAKLSAAMLRRWAIAKGEIQAPAPVVLAPETFGVYDEDAGDVYFARAFDLVKIGYSTGVEGRLEHLRAMNPWLVLSGTVHGSQRLETKLHQRYKRYRTSGEWFVFDPIADEIAQLLTATPEEILVLLATGEEW